MQGRMVAFIAAALTLTACKKTGEGEYQVQVPKVTLDTATVRTPTIGTTTDTVNVPVVGTKKDTIIVDKPVVGTKQTEIRRPTTKRP